MIFFFLPERYSQKMGVFQQIVGLGYQILFRCLYYSLKKRNDKQIFKKMVF